MPDNNTTALIVALKTAQDIESEGEIIQIGNGANTNTVRSLASEKLGLAVALDDIILEAADGEVMTEIDQVRSHQLIYINFKEQVKEVPSPPKLPMVGNL